MTGKINDITATISALSSGVLLEVEKADGTSAKIDGAAVITGFDDTVLVGNLGKWTTARARGSSNPARMFIFGDSNTMGAGSNSGTMGLSNGVSTSLSRVFATNAGFRYDSFIGDQRAVSGGGVAMNTYDPRVTLGGTWAAEGGAGDNVPGGRFFTCASGSGKLRFDPAGSFTKLRFWYPTASGLNGTVTVYVDGVSVGSVNQSAANSLTYADYTVSAGTHYIEIERTGGSGTAYCLGIETFNGTDTPQLITLGNYGATTANLNAAAAVWQSRPGAVTMAPDFVVIYSTINDVSAGTTLSTWRADMEALVAAFAAVADGCLMVGFPHSSTNTTSGYLDQMAKMLRNMANDYGWFYYDARRDVGFSNTRAQNLSLRYDSAHPNGAGHTAIANGLFDFLSDAGLS